ncbi:hypothetical protein TRFO_14857 [Tritrichomonas foetus]|uniref:Uncharacterized protein n=1 Tax=Tritrichomonas foetus TaxID=1144522 RepID=A0A1J4KTU4_9EUKA|nr:hypothetical protein TRFO_14857 [Tritrichomonas foetus]|eukprot:OHT14683.1 hypothetical protein TRFO_14857 [Tritrichomonas foetus]
MEKCMFLSLLSQTIDSQYNTSKQALHTLQNFADTNLSSFFSLCFLVLDDTNLDFNIKFLVLSLVKFIYCIETQKERNDLIQISLDLISKCFSLFPIIPYQSGLLSAEVIFYLSDFMNIDQFIFTLFSLLSNNDFIKGSIEAFIYLCTEIELNSTILNQLLNFILQNYSLSDDLLSKLIDLLTLLFTNQKNDFENFQHEIFSSFLSNILKKINLRPTIYYFLATIIKFNTEKINLFNTQDLFQHIYQDLSNKTNIQSISYLLRKFIKKNLYFSIIFQFLPLLYHISCTQLKATIDLEEEFDDQIASFSVIEQMIVLLDEKSLNFFLPFLDFESNVPQIREISFRILSNLFICCSFTNEQIIQFLNLISNHLNDENLRVRESSLWSLHSIIAKKIVPLELIFPLCERISNFFNDHQVLAAISCEILKEFAIENTCNSTCYLIDFFIHLLQNSLSVFLLLRIQKALLSICSCLLFNPEVILNILFKFTNLLNNPETKSILKENIPNKFIYVLIEQILTNLNNIIDINDHYHFLKILFHLLFHLLIKEITVESISAITSLFILCHPSDNSILFNIYQNNPQISINSIIHFSIIKNEISMIPHFWSFIEDKRKQFFKPFYRHLSADNFDFDCSLVEQIQIFYEIYEGEFFKDMLKIIEVIVSSTSHCENWIEFGFKIIIGKDVNSFTTNEIKQALLFLQSAAASNFQQFLHCSASSNIKLFLSNSQNIEEFMILSQTLLKFLQ